MNEWQEEAGEKSARNMMTISDNNNMNNNNSITGSISHQSQEPTPPELEATATSIVTTAAPVTVTPLSLVVTNLSQHQSGCSAACSHEKRIIRRELQKWAKNVVYLVGESIVSSHLSVPKILVLLSYLTLNPFTLPSSLILTCVTCSSTGIRV